ncbi:MAG: hypothetical protein KAS01_00105 [Candidatus Pacebacteria bacterium]|nr:hypothetical protein [Candidatus Paceibacterota bacterium]
MSISSKLFGNKLNDYFISLDIGSEVVKALIVQLDRKNERAFIIGVGKRYQKNENILIDVKDNFQNIVSVCAFAVDDAVKIAKIRPRKIIIGMDGNFVKGVSIKINYKRKTNKDRIGEKELKSIIAEVQRNLHENVRKIVQKKEAFDSDIFITHSSITNINIDGYKVINPIGFKGSNIEFSIFNSFMLHSHYELIKNISKKLNAELLEIVSQLYAVSIAKGIKNISKSNIILVDIGRKTTSVAVLYKGIIESVKSFNIGEKSFNHHSLSEFDLKATETENPEKRCNKGRMDESSSDKINKAFENYEILLDGIELSLEDFAHINLASFKILFYGEGSGFSENNRDVIIKLLSKRLFPFSKMKIDFIDYRDILKIKDKTNEIKDFQYINSLSLANFIFDKEVEEDQCNKILNNIIK